MLTVDSRTSKFSNTLSKLPFHHIFFIGIRNNVSFKYAENDGNEQRRKEGPCTILEGRTVGTILQKQPLKTTVSEHFFGMYYVSFNYDESLSVKLRKRKTMNCRYSWLLESRVVYG